MLKHPIFVLTRLSILLLLLLSFLFFQLVFFFMTSLVFITVEFESPCQKVRPAGISKGDFIQSLLDEVYADTPPEFVLCVGDDNSDEKGYQASVLF